MNRTWWGITNYNTLETLLHAYHMAEIWEKTSENFKMVARLLDPDSDICTCITDVENNDVLNYMNLLAFKIRYPGITSGNKTITDHCEFSNYTRLHPLVVIRVRNREFRFEMFLVLSGLTEQMPKT